MGTVVLSLGWLVEVDVGDLLDVPDVVVVVLLVAAGVVAVELAAVFASAAAIAAGDSNNVRTSGREIWLPSSCSKFVEEVSAAVLPLADLAEVTTGLRFCL